MTQKFYRLRHVLLQLFLLIFLIPSPLAAQTIVPPKVTFEQVPILLTSKKTGDIRLNVELASSYQQRRTGMMYRTAFPPGVDGMLFDFGNNQLVQMWMKNTPLSLDMIFIEENGNIIRIANHIIPYSEDLITSVRPVRYVLELPAGTAIRYRLLAGDRFALLR